MGSEESIGQDLASTLISPREGSGGRLDVPSHSAAAEPSAPPCSVTIRCEDYGGRRVAGSRYWLIGHRAEELLPIATGESGDLLSLRQILEGDILTVRAVGFADAIVPLAACPDQPMLVEMVRESILSGMVSTSDGLLLPEFTLIAWPRDLPFRPELIDLEDLSRGLAGVLSCKPSADGHFEFSGARARRLYSIYGGGSGLIIAEANIRIVAPRQDLSWKAEPVFAGLAVVRDPSGLPITIQPGSGVGLEFGIPSEGYQPMAGRNLDAVLAGLAVDALVTEPNELLALVAGPSSSDSAGPCRIVISAPGHELFQREFMLDRVHLPLGTIDCVLLPTATEFGSLTVRMVSTPSALEAGSWPAGLVRLSGNSGDAILYRHPGGAAECTFDLVPAGQYTVSFQTNIGGFRVPARGLQPLEVSIGADRTIVEIPMMGLAWIDLDATAGEGKEYRGPLDLMMWRWVSPPGSGAARQIAGMFPCSFEGPPYSISVAESGSYGLKITWPERDPKLHSKSGDTIDVEVGEHVRHVISVLP